MVKAVVICLCIIMLTGLDIKGPWFLSSEALSEGGTRIIIEYADYVSINTTAYSADLINIAENVTPRIVVEYADTIFEHGLESVTVPDISPRIIVEYADSIFSADLERPSFFNQPPTCSIKLLKDGVEISEIDIGEFFDVYVGNSTDDTGIVQVRFSSDDFQDGTPTGEWTEWYDWDVSSGDWNASTKIKRWAFATAGAKEVWAEVKDEIGQTAKCSTNIFAIGPPPENQPPVADAGPNQSVSSGDSVTFDGSDSYDPDGTIVSYIWDFGDGTTAEGRLVEHRFRGAMDQSKTYPVILTVEDSEGSTNTDTTYVTVVPLEKTIEIGGETILHPGFARMTAYYNWIGVTETDGQHEDIYIVSRIHFEGQGYVSYLLSIWDSYSFPVGTPAWSQGLVYFWRPVEKNYVYPFGTYRDKTYTFDDGYFEGMAVGPSDLMKLWGFNVKIISGVAGPIYEGASTSFNPDSITEPEGEVPDLEFAHLASPGELRVYDSQGRVTGLVDGRVKEEIPNSSYNNNTIVIFFLSDSYRYEVAGTGEGSYNLTATNIAEQQTNNFTASTIPMSANAVHQYTFDWGVLSQGEEGVTVKVDSDGDGVFEMTFTSDSELTRDEFMIHVAPAEAFPLWIMGVAIASVTMVTSALVALWRKRKQPPISND